MENKGTKREGGKMESKTHKAAHCPICNATIIVWKRSGIKASLLRALATASHVRASHAGLAKAVA